MSKYIVSLVLAIAFLLATNVRADLVLRFEVAADGAITNKDDFEGEVYGIAVTRGQSGFPTGVGGFFAFTMSGSQLQDYASFAVSATGNSLGTGSFEILQGLRVFDVTDVDLSELESTSAGSLAYDTLIQASNQMSVTFADKVYAFGDDIFSENGTYLIGYDRRTDVPGQRHFNATFQEAVIELTFTKKEESGDIVPEPATLAVLGLGLAGLGVVRARRRK